MELRSRHTCWAALALALACSSARLYYLDSELPELEAGKRRLVVGPGPWPSVPAVLASRDSVPDDLVLSTLKALLDLPGADACDAGGHPLPNASEYCVGVYRTPADWRVTWPIRRVKDAQNSCAPPFGGVEDADFGRGLPVFGYAHNHTCGLFASSPDLGNFPTRKLPSGTWVFVGYGTTPSGEFALDSFGHQIPAWGWLATGHRDAPRFYKWNPAGEVFRWSEDKKQWEFQAVCKPQWSSTIAHDEALPPKCSPELNVWY